MSKPKVYEEDVLLDWVQLCLADKVYPIKIEIVIDKNGKYTIKQQIDGRKLRADFIGWMAKEFTEQTHIVPPTNGAAFNKLWASPMEAMLRQVVYKGGVKYNDLKPEDKYTSLHAICFRVILRDTLEKQREGKLTFSSPNSVEKVGINLAAEGRHYHTAQRLEQRMLESKMATVE